VDMSDVASDIMQSIVGNKMSHPQAVDYLALQFCFIFRDGREAAFFV
jgi:hypothetical protein